MSRVTSAATTSMPFGDAYSITCEVSATTGTSLVRNRFVKLDTAGTHGTGKRPIIYPGAGANAKTILGLVGGYRVQAPITNAASVNTGTAADPYLPGDNVAVTIRGSDLVEAAVALGGGGALACGDLIMTDAAGKAVKFVAGTVSPSMAAAFAIPVSDVGTLVDASFSAAPVGNTNVGTIITNEAVATIGNAAMGTIISGATATIGDAAMGTIISGAAAPLTADHPTAAEIKAFLAEVLPAYNAAEAIKTKAFLAEVLPAYNAAEAIKTKAWLEAIVEATLSAEATLLKAFVKDALTDLSAAEATVAAAYVAEYVSEYIGAGTGGYESVVGVALGAPDADNLVPFLFVGRA